MNTNSKHYEELNIQPWEIMERNFTTEEFVAYLKGNIIKYTLRDKGEALTDAEKIKHYAEKLIEVLEKKEINEFLEEDAERVYGKAKPVSEHKFKVGDRVRVLVTDETGTIIRTPVKGLSIVDQENYIIKIDKENSGWDANKREHLVESDNAWYANDDELELLTEEPKKTLEHNKWYDAEDFTVEELKELLPVGTVITVTKEHESNREVNLEDERLLSTTVNKIGTRWYTNEVRVGVAADFWWRRHFKITEE